MRMEGGDRLAFDQIVESVARGLYKYIPMTSPSISMAAESVFPISEVVKSSYAPARLAGAGIYVVPNMKVGYRFVLKWKNGFFNEPNALPGYYDVINRNIEERRHAESTRITVRKENAAFAVFTVKYKEYGHFLIETLPKMLMARNIIDNGIDVPVMIPQSPPGWVRQYIDIIFKGCKIVEIDEYAEEVDLDVALVPTILGGYGGYEPVFRDLVRKYVTIADKELSNSKLDLFLSRRKFLSNKKQIDFRKLMNEIEIEEIAVNHGFMKIEPENMSVQAQIEMFHSARRVIGEFSSALHNTIFAPSNCYVLAMNYANPVQTFLCKLNGQKIDFTLPSDGSVRTWENRGKIDPNYLINASEVLRWIEKTAKII